MKKIAGILVALVFLFSLFGTASALNYHELKVQPFDEATTPAPDTIKVTGTESWTWTNVNGAKEYSLYLPHGTYDITVIKAGYEDYEYKNLVIGDESPAVVNVYYHFEAVDQGGDDGGQDGGTDGSVTEPNMKIKLNIEPDDEVKPGQEVELEVEVENRLGYDVEDVTITVTVDEMDDGDDWEDEKDIGNLRGKDRKEEETETFTFTVPYDADEGKHNILVEVEWDDNGYNKLEETLDVEKEKHDVEIVNAYVGSTTVQPGKTTELAVELANIGENDENVRIKVESQDLGIEEWTAQFELEDGDTVTQYLTFAVPANAVAGKYFLHVNAYYNSGTDVDAEFVTLTVDGETTATSGAVTMTPVVTTVATGDSAGFTDDTFVVGGLIVGILVLLAVIATVAKHVIPRRATIVESTRRRR